jgi:transcription elongation factor GreA
MWYLRAYLADRLPERVRKESRASLLEKALVLHSHLDVSSMRDQDEDKKSLAKSLANTLANRDFALIQEAFEGATVSETASLAALLKGNRSLNSDVKDKMLAVMFRTRPETGKFGSESPTGTAVNPLFDGGILYTTERALLRKRAEYEDVVNRQIPENASEIGRAASYGDLSENSEWTAAIEKQERLTKQAEELGAEIGKARLIDPSLQDGRTITLGSRVTVGTPEGVSAESTILGPWDVDSARGFISYLSPLGHALVGRTVNEEVQVQVPSGTLRYMVKSLSNGLASGEALA